METLADEIWDVVIVGTSLPQALLALSLSRSDLRILHVDQNNYYGGTDAGLSLDEARAWVEMHKDGLGRTSSAVIAEPSTTDPKLSSSRAYTLSLSPQIVYAQSLFLPSLVSSHINEQLEFLAVGSWWICRDGKLQKVPSSREDVFADDVLSRRDKIGLMKLLRSVVQEETEDTAEQDALVQHDQSLGDALTSQFKLASQLKAPILSLALEPQSANAVNFEFAKSRIRRHMKSIGHFGPGFGAVIAKYAGNAEIAQVACRACAVGGATYLLGHSLSDTQPISQDGQLANLRLTSGMTIQAKNVVGDMDSLPSSLFETTKSPSFDTVQICRSISIASDPLRSVFMQTAENGPVPAAVIVLVGEDGDDEESLERPPIYLQVHSDDTGECPQGQSLIYASTLHPETIEPANTHQRLEQAVQRFLASVDESHQEETLTRTPQLIWSISYVSTGVSCFQTSFTPFTQDESGRILAFPPSIQDIAFNDNALDSVKAVWKKILGDAADESSFMRFENRSQEDAG